MIFALARCEFVSTLVSAGTVQQNSLRACMGSAPQAEMGLKSIAVIFVDVSARPSLRRFSPAHCVESRLIRTMSRRGAKLAVAVVLALHSVLVSAAPDYILAQVTGQQGVSMGRFVSVTSGTSAYSA